MYFAYGVANSTNYPGLFPASTLDAFSTIGTGLDSFGDTWVSYTSASGTNNLWSSVSLSASGQYQTACTQTSNVIYTSDDYGSSWVLRETLPGNRISSVSLSASGKYQTACTYSTTSGSIYTSDDFGATWTQNTSAPTDENWKSVSLSASGQYQTAVIYYSSLASNTGAIYNSYDFGATWTQNSSAPTQQTWQSVSLSASGQYQTSVVYSGSIYNSYDFGATWTQNSSAPTGDWFSVSISGTGQYQVACIFSTNGSIYVSMNYGSTFTVVSDTSDTYTWSCVSISESGQYIVATKYLNNASRIYASSDYGSTFTLINSYAGTYYVSPRSISISASGQYITACFQTTEGAIVTCTNYFKSFVIDHPVDYDKYLVHACLEGPESGVYYRGTHEITNNESTVVHLPNYVEHFSFEFTVQVSPIYQEPEDKEEEQQQSKSLGVSKVENNQFTVYGNNCEFFWIVSGTRISINVEPMKKKCNMNGNGPYRWIG